MDLDVQPYSLGHLGIVAGIFNTLKIGEVIAEVMLKHGSGHELIFFIWLPD